MKRSRPDSERGPEPPEAKIPTDEGYKPDPLARKAAAKESCGRRGETSESADRSNGQGGDGNDAASYVADAGTKKSKEDARSAATQTMLSPDYSKVTYTSPRNFAERLMGVLESGVASELIWWVGDGNAVALHPRKLKKTTLLEPYFRVKNYSALIRNFNRWGFKRVNYYSATVPDGVVTYQNSLFRKAQPHLVKHMRMDSDVQDVFERHQQPGPETQQSPRSATIRSSQSVSDSQQTGRNLQSQQQSQLMNLGQPQNAPSNAFASDAVGVLGQQEAVQPTVQMPSFVQQQPATQQNGGTPSSQSTVTIAQLIQIAEQYLSQPASSSIPESCNNSIRATLELLILLGQKNQPQQQQQQQPLQQPMNASQLGNYVAQQRQNQIAHSLNGAGTQRVALPGIAQEAALRQNNQSQPNIAFEALVRQLRGQSQLGTSVPQLQQQQPQQQMPQPAQHPVPQQGILQQQQQAPDLQAMMRLLLEQQEGMNPNNGR